MTKNQTFCITFIASFVAAYLSWSAPTYRMPIDYDAMISRSVPFAIAWVAILGFCFWRSKRRGLWLLLGSPMALYWPIWLLFNHFPPCYYLHNCD
jgi:FtsH-binding integral membrane protein